MNKGVSTARLLGFVPSKNSHKSGTRAQTDTRFYSTNRFEGLMWAHIHDIAADDVTSERDIALRVTDRIIRRVWPETWRLIEDCTVPAERETIMADMALEAARRYIVEYKRVSARILPMR